MEQSLGYIIERLEAIDGKFDEKLDKILVQTTKTNGRVNGHDKAIEALEKHVEILRETKDVNKGRDRVIYIVIGCLATLSMTLLTIYLKNKA